MKNYTLLSTIILSAALSMTSCVSSKKYKALEFEQANLKRDYNELTGVKKEKETLFDEKRKLEGDQKTLKNQLSELQSQYLAVEQTKNEWLQKYETLLNDNKNVLDNATSEKMQLSDELQKKTTELNAKEARLKQLESGLKTQQTDLNQLKTSLADREKRVQELEGILKAQDAKMTELRNKITTALKSFSAADLQVHEENGKVYVSLSQNLLFGTGSSKIDQKGVEALKQLSAVLNNNPETDITVEGHTDNTGTADINWQLSLDRANTVVKILTSNKVDGKRISASGRAMFLPIADNANADGKAKNRRTEIILSPKLDALYDIIKAK